MIDANWAGVLVFFGLICGLCIGWALGFIEGTPVRKALAKEEVNSRLIYRLQRINAELCKDKNTLLADGARLEEANARLQAALAAQLEAGEMTKTILGGQFLFWRPEGPQLEYRDGTLFIADLNPEVELKWRISRKELFAIGLRCLRAAFSGQ